MAYLKWLLLVVIVGVCWACDTLPGPASACPPAPADPGYGMPATPVSTSSLNIELSQGYLRERVRALMDAPSTASSGVEIGTVRLSQETDAQGAPLHLLNVVISPWLRGNGDSLVSLQRSYELKLQLVPYLITPVTEPDSARRRTLLCPNGPCTNNSGLLLRFAFYELFSRINQAPVVCGSANYDMIDGQVLTSVYKSMETAKPIVVQADGLLKMASDLAGTPVQVTGVALGSDLELKVGLRFDVGIPGVFDPQVSLSHFPDADWGVSLDTSLLSMAVRRSAIAQATATDPRLSIGGVNITYTPFGFEVKAAGTINLCGGISFTASTLVKPQLCRKSDGRVVLQVCSGKAETSPQTNVLQVICYLGSQFLGSFSGGWANAVIKTGNCPDMGTVSFQAGPGDVLYGIKLDTDNIFYIAGRSTFMDGRLSRTPAPADCN
ncbi:MAG: hypothetical protein SF052_23165 [Bacteroidia bacterium]|nr:hypothetical protein [Bacteroidia bacterium]